MGAPKEKLIEFYYHLEQYVNSKESINLTEIFPDTYDTIIDLKLMEATLGIVTSNNVKHVKDILQKFDMQTFSFLR